MLTRKVSFLGLVSIFLAGSALGGDAIPNWSAPATWSPARAHGGLTTMGDVTFPLPFIGANPCRIADTRNSPGPYGAPALTGGVPRNFTLTGQCGIPTGAAAVSLNVTVTNTQGAGFIETFPAGGGVPPGVSTLNYVGGQTIANAAVVPLGNGGANTGAITVIAGVSGTDLILDTNGYYASAPASPGTFLITNSTLGPIISVFNNSLSCTTTCGIRSSIVSTAGTSGTPAYAMSGLANGGTGLTVGVLGASLSTTTSAAGVFGEALATTGTVYGVFGHSNSATADAGGVFGSDSLFGPLNPYDSAGVRGESVTGNGVLGVSRFTGVAGSVVDTSGTEMAFGLLGYNNGTAYGVYSGGKLAATGTKMFVEPHPTDASKVIRYVSLEGPEAGTYFRGRGRFQNGLATIDVPEDFRMVTDSEGLSIQMTPIGELATVAVVRIDLEGILVKASRNVEFFYTVNGVRRTHRDLQPIGPGSEFVPSSADARMPAYLTEGQKALLVSNGTYNADGTVNMETAERLGWVKMWADREAQARAAAAANAAARAAMLGERRQPPGSP